MMCLWRITSARPQGAMAMQVDWPVLSHSQHSSAFAVRLRTLCRRGMPPPCVLLVRGTVSHFVLAVKHRSSVPC